MPKLPWLSQQQQRQHTHFPFCLDYKGTQELWQRRRGKKKQKKKAFATSSSHQRDGHSRCQSCHSPIIIHNVVKCGITCSAKKHHQLKLVKQYWETHTYYLLLSPYFVVLISSKKRRRRKKWDVSCFNYCFAKSREKKMCENRLPLNFNEKTVALIIVWKTFPRSRQVDWNKCIMHRKQPIAKQSYRF